MCWHCERQCTHKSNNIVFCINTDNTLTYLLVTKYKLQVLKLLFSLDLSMHILMKLHDHTRVELCHL